MASTKKKLKKYKISGKSYVLLILLFVVCVFGYAVLCYCINTIPSVGSNPVWLTVKDSVIVVLTIFGTNLLLSAIIEVNSQNKLISDFFSTDVVSAPVFYKNIDQKERRQMLETLELMDNCNEKEKLHEMYNSIKLKMNVHIDDQYYFEKTEYEITVEEEEDYFRKKTTKTVYVKSYEPHCSITGFNLATIVYNDLIPQSLDDDKIVVTVCENGREKTYDKKSLIIKPSKNIGKIQKKNGYSKNVEINLKKHLKINSENSIPVKLYYEILCDKQDLVSSYRTKHPCKSFSVMYTVISKSAYKLIGHAFGFHERAINAINPEADNIITMGFDDWIFTDDGICITMVKNQND